MVNPTQELLKPVKPASKSITIVSAVIAGTTVLFTAGSPQLHELINNNVKDEQTKANLNTLVSLVNTILAGSSLSSLTMSVNKYLAENKNVYTGALLPGRDKEQAVEGVVVYPEVRDNQI
jgi:hypothetical protein